MKVEAEMRNFLSFLLVLGSWVFCSAKSLHKQKSYDGYKVFRVMPQIESQLEFLEKLWINDTSLSLDFWTSPRYLSRPVDVMVPPKSIPAFLTELDRRRMNYTTMMANVQSGIEMEEETIKYASSILRDSASVGNWNGHNGFRLDIYHSYADMQQFMRDLARDRSDIVELITLRDDFRRAIKTHQGRELTMVKIGKSKPQNQRKPAFWIDGGIHAREWVAVTVPIYIMNELVTKYESDEQIRQYVDEIDFYIIPCVNPDGYEASRGQDRMWRKNGNPNDGQRFSWCRGVDLNRNFDWWFGGEGSSSDPCKETYRGKHAFSEPESQGVKEIVGSIKWRLEAFVTLHSYSQIWMYPYGHKRDTRAPDWRELARVANSASNKLGSLYGTKYSVDTGANALYPAAGGSDDWAKGTMGIKYVYLIELRPEDEVDIRRISYGFLLPASQILPTAVETWEGLKVVADAILARNGVQRSSVNRRPSVCEDKETMCTWWSSTGGCEKHKSYMSGHCAKTCKLCQQDDPTSFSHRESVDCLDTRTDCNYWIENSLCNWVEKGCAKSCGLC